MNTYYADSDGDGFGNGGNIVFACNLPSDFVENSDDCDDDRTVINPLSDERWQERLRLKRAPSQISDKINIRTIKLNWKIPIKWGHFLVNKNNLLYPFLDEKVSSKIGK